MPRRAVLIFASFAVLCAAARAQDTHGVEKNALHAYMLESVKAKITAAPATATATPASDAKAADEPVKLAPVIVRERRFPPPDEVDVAMKKSKSLESRALYHTELTKKIRMEVGLPPAPGGKGGGLSLPLLRLSW